MLEVPNRDRRVERREATKDEILTAAWDLVRAQGLAALSLRDLAGVVGMKAPSLYSYFDSKNAIYDAMFAQGARAYLEQEARVPTSGDPLTDLRADIRFFVRFCTEDPARYQLMFQRTIPGFVPSRDTFAIAVEGLERLRARLAAMGLTDPRTVDLLTAIGTGLTDQQISNDPGGERWTRLIDDAMEMFFAHVTKAKATPKGRRPA
ncbi:MAG: TetR/AcrR family transcriptional regulator [Ilumatobacteraceae bacterium]|nr:TetR/AcrR family transcriptional regulator [Ilumatobacteraceae bacterium]